MSTAPAQALPSLLPVPQPRPVSGVSRPCLVLSVSPPCRVMIAPALTLQHAYSKVQRGGARPSHSTRLCTLLSPPPFWNFPWDSAVLGGRLGKLSPALEGGWLGKREGDGGSGVPLVCCVPSLNPGRERPTRFRKQLVSPRVLRERCWWCGRDSRQRDSKVGHSVCTRRSKENCELVRNGGGALGARRVRPSRVRGV